jgi:alcohol dehydrogenase
MVAAVMFQQGLPTPYSDSKPFKIEQVDLEGPNENEVLVEVRAAGLCHSDLSQVAGLRKRSLPVVGGHEGAGVVVEVGRGVRRLKPGDHVVMSGAPGCGFCSYCGDDRPNLCENVAASRAAGGLTNGARKLSLNGQPLFHYSGISSFAQYAVATPETLIKVDPDIPLEVATLYGCGVVTGAGAVFNTAQLRPGRRVAVIGLGGVGLNAVMAAKISGASEIIGVDILDDKFPLAQELGCTRTVNAANADMVQMIKDWTGGGVDFAFEVTGNRRAVASAFAMCRKGGDVICIGLGASGDMLEYPHASLVGEQKGLRGTFMGGGNAAGDIPRYARYYKEGRMPVDRLMSGTMIFEQLNANLDALDRGSVLRQVLLPQAA